MSSDASRKPINPSAMALVDAAQMFAKVSGHSVTEAMLQNDVAVGAPANGDGTINLVHYAAWLVKETVRGD